MTLYAFKYMIKGMIVLLIGWSLSALAAAPNLTTLIQPNVTIEQIKAALDAGANPNAKDRFGATVLMLAADRVSDPYVVALLIKAGADINAVDLRGDTALIRVSRKNYGDQHYKMTSLLVGNGAAVDIKGGLGKTALNHLYFDGETSSPKSAALLKSVSKDPAANKELYPWWLKSALLPALRFANPNTYRIDDETPHNQGIK